MHIKWREMPMNIRLPKQFHYKEKRGNGYAYVKKHKLIIIGPVNFESLMYKLTYEIYGDDTCRYCGAKLNRKIRTLDHMYPRAFGGISVPNNLLPACKHCNQEKMDMTFEQYKTYQSLKTPADRKIFYTRCFNKNTTQLQSGHFILNSKWIEMYDISKITSHFTFKNISPERIKEIDTYYKTYHAFPHPLIVSGNDWLFYGKHILYYAKRHKINKVSAIVLHNVEVFDR